MRNPRNRTVQGLGVDVQPATRSRVAGDRDAPVGVFDNRGRRAVRAATVFTLALSVAVSTRSGIGLSITVAAGLLSLSWMIRHSATTARWCAVAAALAPWLVVRDNTWLAISIVCTSLLVVGLAALAAAVEQPINNLSLGAILRRGPKPDVAAVLTAGEETAVSVARGLLFATPVVALFWALLASADEVFAKFANPSIIPFARGTLFMLSLPLAIAAFRVAVMSRPSLPPVERKRFGVVEATVVLSAVSALFAFFIAIRIATAGRTLSDEAWRSEVRSGFFQLLWVAALTVLLVLALRQLAGRSELDTRLRRLSVLTIAFAAVIDGLAMMRIAEYVERSFLSPLRFWSFGFGLWLLVVLAMTALRLTSFKAATQWFTFALVTSWVVFVFAMGIVNPDHRIAEHNFANAPTGVDEWIAVRPLMWLSEDATPVIVENIDVLRPMPNDRYVRVRSHLCTRAIDESWRDFHFSRRAARKAIADLC